MKVDVKEQVVLWGAKGHAKVLREGLGYFGYELVALFDNNRDTKSPFPDVPLYYGRDGFQHWSATVNLHDAGIFGMVAIGGQHGKVRHEIQSFLQKHSIVPITLMHPTAFCAANAIVGKGSQILANATVCVEVTMGESCIINTAAVVEHECILGDGVHLCPGSRLAGDVKVGSYSMVGLGATVLPGIIIGSNVIIGAGAVVTRNVANNVVIYGNPARFVRYNK